MPRSGTRTDGRVEEKNRRTRRRKKVAPGTRAADYRCSLPGLAEFVCFASPRAMRPRGSEASAEKEGFEPSVPFDTHDFQSCPIGHSGTSPIIGGRSRPPSLRQSRCEPPPTARVSRAFGAVEPGSEPCASLRGFLALRAWSLAASFRCFVAGLASLRGLPPRAARLVALLPGCLLGAARVACLFACGALRRGRDSNPRYPCRYT